MDVKIRDLNSVTRTQVEEMSRRTAKVVPYNKIVWARVLGRYNLMLDTTDLSVAMPIALDGYWEMWMTRCVINHVKEGWGAIDVGASFGYYTMLLADLVGERGEVEAWEPNARVAAMLRRSLLMNGELSPRVLIRDAAASDSNGTGYLSVPGRTDLGGAGIDPKGAPPIVRNLNADSANVELKRLDETKLKRVDFIKIDAEGHEPQIWNGMTRLLERGEPQCIMMEFTAKAYSDPRGFLDTIQQAGFEIAEVNSESLLEKVDTSELVDRQLGWVPLWLTRQHKTQVAVP